MQMEELGSTAGLKPNAAANTGRGARNTDVPVDKIQNSGASPAGMTSGGDTKAVSNEAVKEAVDRLQEYAGIVNFNIGFDRDDETDTMVIKIIDRESGEMVHQIPPDQILKLRSHLRDVLGMVFDHMA